MPQPAPAPKAKTETITIDANLVARPSPAPTISYSAGDNVLFNAAVECVLTFNPTDVFGASKTLSVGNNGPYRPSKGDVTVDYWVNPLSASPDPGPYVIPVGS